GLQFRVARRARLVRGGFVVKRFAFAVPGDLATPTGGYAYNRRMIAELGDLGWQIDLLNLGEGFPWPNEATRTTARTRLLASPAGRTIVIDGLALGVLPEAASQLAGRNPLLALVHHPLALEQGLSAEQADALRASERAALAAVQGVVVTSAATARLGAADYGVPAGRITVARPGSDPVPLAQASQDGVVRLLSVRAVVPRKGFDVLIAALGAVSPQRLAALYAEADVFVLASRFEGYGMAYAEALAHGLPVIGTSAGAIPDTVPPDAGLLVVPGDIPAFAQALRRVIGDAELRRRLASAARAAALRLPTWRQSAEILARALETLA